MLLAHIGQGLWMERLAETDFSQCSREVISNPAAMIPKVGGRGQFFVGAMRGFRDAPQCRDGSLPAPWGRPHPDNFASERTFGGANSGVRISQRSDIADVGLRIRPWIHYRIRSRERRVLMIAL